MTRLAGALAVGGAMLVVVLLWAAMSRDDGDQGYLVRAAFDTASGLRAGMEVRVAGVKVGDVREVTLDQDVPAIPRAVAVMDITAPGMADFRANARCTVRAASLIGDRFVDCAPRAPDKPSPPLPAVKVGGEVQHVLPVSRTSSPVDPDLVLDIFRLPVRQRLSIIINELGAGLAGNGGALREAVRRADPSVLQLNRVLQTVSEQRRALAALADSGARVLEPLARERRHLVGVAVHGAQLNEAVARRGTALRGTFSRLPAFLTGLRSTLREIDGLSATSGPVFADLDRSADRLSKATEQLAPIARAGTPAFRALGDSAPAQAHGLRAARPVLSQLEQITPAAKPVAGDLSSLLESLRKEGGIERLSEVPRALALIGNGFDRYGYFGRTNALATTCTTYVTTPFGSCQGNFIAEGGSTEAAQAASTRTGARAGAARSAAPATDPARGKALLDYLLGSGS
jgi:phospholipid/cholesterol/gamma-HCH transport system substrate-binding protein